MSMLFLILIVILVIWFIALVAGTRGIPVNSAPWAPAGDWLAWLSVVILTLLFHGVRF